MLRLARLGVATRPAPRRPSRALLEQPVSAGLLTDTSGYFDALTAYRNGEPSAIVQKLAEASFAAATNGRQLVRDLRSIRKSWDGKLTARRGATAWRLVDVLLRQPVIDTPTVARELGVTPQNALRAITPLVNAGILDEFTGFARNYFRFKPSDGKKGR